MTKKNGKMKRSGKKMKRSGRMRKISKVPKKIGLRGSPVGKAMMIGNNAPLLLLLQLHVLIQM
ncbi:hypothetical protein A2V82_10425 [candidate division KSB1 bacterium RBG_16_48_16]|nr:MAG: hypothetical protein A2V82_10425 [candidate division KSB1 bacterium RBG_16_48_16]